MTGGVILIVDDEPKILQSFSSLLTDEGYSCETAESAEEASQRIGRRIFDLILLDIQLPKESGLEFLRRIRSEGYPAEVLVISGAADIPMALEAIKLGAVDFLEKPVPPERLLSSINAALQLAAANRQRHLQLARIEDESPMVGVSPAMVRLRQAIADMAPTNSTVLITGENGTGKELVATHLFLESDRRDKPFVKVNCPGIPETLFESELFGHVKGAFTGAVRDYPGKFVLADGGTLFLDEIGDLPLTCQAKLLRVLETGEVETLGAPQTRTVDVRIICATNRDLKGAVDDGSFRADLYYRISVLMLKVPSLAERCDDIPLLAGEFLRRFDPKGATSFSADAIAWLSTQPHPGNVRQLKNLVERMCILKAGREITRPMLEADPVLDDHTPDSQPLSLAEHLAQFEKSLITETLRLSNGNISEAARRLGTDRSQLSRKIRDMGLKGS
jgi:two-component system nitrogen regulation response regulator NtrX